MEFNFLMGRQNTQNNTSKHIILSLYLATSVKLFDQSIFNVSNVLDYSNGVL